MSKKHKHKLKEIERLRALYGEVQAKASEPTSMSSQTPSEIEEVPASVDTTTSDSHGYVKKDLVGLVILIVGMLVVLVGFNWLVGNTGFSQWLIGLFGA